MKNEIEERIAVTMRFLESVGAINDGNRFAVESELIGLALAVMRAEMNSYDDILEKYFQKNKNKKMKNKITFISRQRMFETTSILSFIGLYDYRVSGNNIYFESEEIKMDAMDDIHNFHWCEGCTTGGSAQMSDKDGCYYCETCQQENENVYPEHNNSYLE